MSNFNRKNTSTSKIKDSFSRDVDAENRKKFNTKLIFLLLGVSLLVYIIWPKGGKTDPNLGRMDTTVVSHDTLDKPEKTEPKIEKSIQIRSMSNKPDAVFGNFKASFESKKQQLSNNSPDEILFEFESFYINNVNGIIVTSLNVIPGKNGFSKYRLVLNPVGGPTESLDNTLAKNDGSRRINSQILNGYQYHLVGLK
jgi:hypothetical protein